METNPYVCAAACGRLRSIALGVLWGGPALSRDVGILRSARPGVLRGLRFDARPTRTWPPPLRPRIADCVFLGSQGVVGSPSTQPRCRSYLEPAFPRFCATATEFAAYVHSPVFLRNLVNLVELQRDVGRDRPTRRLHFDIFRPPSADIVHRWVGLALATVEQDSKTTLRSNTSTLVRH